MYASIRLDLVLILLFKKIKYIFLIYSTFIRGRARDRILHIHPFACPSLGFRGTNSPILQDQDFFMYPFQACISTNIILFPNYEIIDREQYRSQITGH